MATPNATNGTTVLLSVRISTGPDVYTDVGSQSNVTFERTLEEIDASNKNDGADTLVLAGRRKQTLTLDHMFVLGETAFEVLKTAVERLYRACPIAMDSARNAAPWPNFSRSCGSSMIALRSGSRITPSGSSPARTALI